MFERAERIFGMIGIAVVYVVALAFVAEHIYIQVDLTRNPPQLVEACPVKK